MKKMTKKIGYVTAAIFMLGAFAACYNEIESEPRQAGGLLPIAGAYNVRDLGGYKTADGKKHIKSGKLIRTGSLDLLTERDKNYLFGEIGVKTIVDFRSNIPVVQDNRNQENSYGNAFFIVEPSEQDSSPDRKPVSGVKTVDAGIPESMIVPEYESILSGSQTVDQIKQSVEAGYKRIVVGDSGANQPIAPNGAKTQYKLFFDTLLDSNGDPVLFHCSAGKDRTGVAAALLLSALGVDRDTIIQDYLKSAENVAEKYYPVGPYIAKVAEEQILTRYPQAKELVRGAQNAVSKGINEDTFYTQALTDTVIRGMQKNFLQGSINQLSPMPSYTDAQVTGARQLALGLTYDTLETGNYMKLTKQQFQGAVTQAKKGMTDLANILQDPKLPAGTTIDQVAKNQGEEAAKKVEPLLTVKEEYIKAAFQAIADAGFSSVEAYLTSPNGLGLTQANIESLKALYLE